MKPQYLPHINAMRIDKKTDFDRTPGGQIYRDLDLPPEELDNPHQLRGGVAGSLPIAPSFQHPAVAQPKKPAPEPGDWSPALQSLLDRPPSSLPARLMMGGLAFCAAFGTWSYFGTIDEVGEARGELIPQGDVYKVHPVESGKVVRIAVEEGEAVKVGEAIAELDTQMAAAEVERLQQRLQSLQLERSQQRQLLDRTHLEAQTRASIARAQIQARQAERDRIDSQMAATRQLLAQLELNQQAGQSRLENLQPLDDRTDELLEKLRADEAAAAERVERLSPLVEAGAISQEVIFQAEQSLRDRQRAIVQAQMQEQTGSEEQVFQAEEHLRDSERRITQSQGELQQLRTDAARLDAELDRQRAEAEASVLQTQEKIQQLELKLTQLDAEIADTQNLIASAETKLQQRFLYAPIDGTVSSLNVANFGEVLQPGQTFAEITPEDTPLVLSASLPEGEAGFLETGMPAKIKFDAYPYQEYGVIEGTVTSISPDTKPVQEGQAVYKVEIVLERDFVVDDGEQIEFKPGQTATASIVIRQRRIVDLFLDPIRKIQKQGLEL